MWDVDTAAGQRDSSASAVTAKISAAASGMVRGWVSADEAAGCANVRPSAVHVAKGWAVALRGSTMVERARNSNVFETGSERQDQ